jgi:hypothetical protein
MRDGKNMGVWFDSDDDWTEREQERKERMGQGAGK